MKLCTGLHIVCMVRIIYLLAICLKLFIYMYYYNALIFICKALESIQENEAEQLDTSKTSAPTQTCRSFFIEFRFYYLQNLQNIIFSNWNLMYM